MFALEITAVVFLIVVNGLLAMSEMAIVSSRTSRLKAMVDQDVVGARRAWRWHPTPAGFFRPCRSASPWSVCCPALFRRDPGPAFCRLVDGAGSFAGCGGRGRRRCGGGDHHLCLADRGRAGAQADRAARSRADGGAGGARHGVGRAADPRRWCGCWMPRAAWCWRCCARTMCAKNASLRKKSRP